MPHPDIPMVSSAEFKAVAAAVEDMFGSQAARDVFVRHGFSQRLLNDPLIQFPNTEYMRFLEACARTTGEPLFGALIGDSVPFAKLGLYGQYVVSSPTLAIVLHRASRALKFHESGSSLHCEIAGTFIRVAYVPPTPNALGSWHQSDGVAAMLINLVREYEEPSWKPTRVSVTSANSLRKSRLRDFFECDIGDCAIGTELIGEVQKLHHPLSARGEGFSWTSLRLMVSGQPPETFSGTLRSLIGPLVRKGHFDLSEISSRIGFSPRTVQRRLEAEGTTFGAILRDARRAWAKELLATNSMPLSEIAPLLGYSSKQQFIRAFRSWTGVTPARFRASRSFPAA